MRSPQRATIARAAKPPPPVWIGIPSALATSVPSGSVMKQEKSWLWLKIVDRAVRVITHPMWRLIWSSRFCISDSTIGSWRACVSVSCRAVFVAVSAASPPVFSTKSPLRSTVSSENGPTNSVVVTSSTSSGPASLCPPRRSAPRKTGVPSQPCSPCHTLRNSKGVGDCETARLVDAAIVPVEAVATTRADAIMMVPPSCTWP